VCDLSVFTCCQQKCINHGHLDLFYFRSHGTTFVFSEETDLHMCRSERFFDFNVSKLQKKNLFFQFGFLPSNITSCGTTFGHSVSVAISDVSGVPEIKINYNQFQFNFPLSQKKS
jgi:hypothetical protein